MKRTNYHITLHGCRVETRYAWNSAWHKAMPDLVWEIARKEGQLYSLVEKKVEKNMDGEHIRGYQIWKGQKDGMTVKFEIEKEISE
jgi:hypothetical protein